MNALQFFSEVFGIVFIGASYNIYVTSENSGILVLIIGIILLILSKMRKT